MISKPVRIFFLLLCAAQSLAQMSTEHDLDIVSQRGTVRIMPLYQRWSLANASFSEASAVLSWYQPIGRTASISIRSAYGAAQSGDTSLNGPTDVQLAGTYYIEDVDLVFNLGVGIPSGKRNLTFDEFLTSVWLANNVFRSQVARFGAGFNVSPSVVWAISASDEVVIGLGAMFQYRGKFSPLATFDSYDPGDEVSVTGGVDIKLDETSSIAADMVFTLFGKDNVGGLDVFSAGNKLLASVQFQKFFEMDALGIFFTFRTKAKPVIGFGTLEPNQSEIVATYAAHFSKRVSTQFLLEGRFFQQTPAPRTGFNMIGVGVAPEFKLSETLSLPLRLKYLYASSKRDGKLNGVEVGLGVVVRY